MTPKKTAKKKSRQKQEMCMIHQRGDYTNKQTNKQTNIPGDSKGQKVPEDDDMQSVHHDPQAAMCVCVCVLS